MAEAKGGAVIIVSLFSMEGALTVEVKGISSALESPLEAPLRRDA